MNNIACIYKHGTALSWMIFGVGALLECTSWGFALKRMLSKKTECETVWLKYSKKKRRQHKKRRMIA
jgi:hypothetical protein